MPDTIRFPASEMAVEIDVTHGAVFFNRCRPGAHSVGESCGGLLFADMVALVKAMVERFEADQLDRHLVERFEDMVDARFDAVSAHWGHD